jgi:hypothetical protein
VNFLKHSKIGFIALLLFGMVIALTGIVCADQPVPSAPETQSLVTGTTADIVGLAMETDTGAWTLTNDAGSMVIQTYTTNAGAVPLYFISYPYPGALSQLTAAGGSYTVTINSESHPDPQFISQISIPTSLLGQQVAGGGPGLTWQWIDNLFIANQYSQTITQGGIHTGALNPSQVQYTTAYDANIVAQAGHTSFIKSMNIDTRNKVIGQSNINAQTGLTYIATADGGNVVGSENLLIDGAGNTTKASDRMLCPFAAGTTDVIPAYCNIVQAGSKYDLTVGSVTTSANDRFVGSDATNQVVLNYAIDVKPYGSTAAIGSTSAYIKAHIQEARTANLVDITPIWSHDYTFIVPGTPIKVEDLTYNEQSSAQGTISSFQKVIAYQSGKALI